MSCTASEIIKQAQAWVGKKESNNSHREIIDIYNVAAKRLGRYIMSYYDPWCVAFIGALAQKCNATDIIPVTADCTSMITYLKGLGVWEESDAHVPSPGELILFDWQDSGSGDNVNGPDHIGIVEKCTNGTITTIEGNKSDAVGRRTLKVNGLYIRGFGKIKYSNSTTDNVAESGTKTVRELAEEVIKGYWGVGSERKELLTAAGYDYTTVQEMVNKLMAETDKKSVTDIAKEVIVGKWGAGLDRMNRLTAAGYDYDEVQRKVNELLKK